MDILGHNISFGWKSVKESAGKYWLCGWQKASIIMDGEDVSMKTKLTLLAFLA